MSTGMDYGAWLRLGLEMGWCGAAVCITHDDLPTTPDEDDQFDRGLAPCIHVLRIYENADVRIAVEQNHAPSVWRKTEWPYG